MDYCRELIVISIHRSSRNIFRYNFKAEKYRRKVGQTSLRAETELIVKASGANTNLWVTKNALKPSTSVTSMEWPCVKQPNSLAPKKRLYGTYFPLTKNSAGLINYATITPNEEYWTRETLTRMGSSIRIQPMQFSESPKTSQESCKSQNRIHRRKS